MESQKGHYYWSLPILVNYLIFKLLGEYSLRCTIQNKKDIVLTTFFFSYILIMSKLMNEN
jgi:hypothetical protein